jgi:predicted nucleic acid-binding protein
VTERLVVDASALVDLLAHPGPGRAITARLADGELHAPAHVDAEVLSGLGRLHRAGALTAEQVRMGLMNFAAAPVTRHALAPLLAGAWQRRHQLRLADALYAELAEALGVPLITTDARLAEAFSGAESVPIEP